MRTVMFSTAVIAGVVWMGIDTREHSRPVSVRNRQYEHSGRHG